MFKYTKRRMRKAANWANKCNNSRALRFTWIQLVGGTHRDEWRVALAWVTFESQTQPRGDGSKDAMDWTHQSCQQTQCKERIVQIIKTLFRSGFVAFFGVSLQASQSTSQWTGRMDWRLCTQIELHQSVGPICTDSVTDCGADES